MKFFETIFNEAFIIEIEPKYDDRGFFARTFCGREFKEYGLKYDMVQTNLSYSCKKGTLRGMHYQVQGAEEAKLIRCIKGSIVDCIVDVRRQSETFGKYIIEELSESNNRMLYVPEGFAHGFLTLTDDCYVSYQVSNFYSPGKERGIRWDDPFFSIIWPVASPSVISEKDASWDNFVLEQD